MIIPSTEFNIEYNKYIYIIRHCEKITNKDTGLSITGLIYSNCLPSYFEQFPFGEPNALYTALSPTSRSIDTLILLAILLELPIYDITNTLKNMEHIVSIIKKAQKCYNIILITWEHTKIPILAQSLGCRICKSWSMEPTQDNKPEENLYDTIWVLEYEYTNVINFYTFKQNFNNDKCVNMSNYTYQYTKQ